MSSNVQIVVEVSEATAQLLFNAAKVASVPVSVVAEYHLVNPVYLGQHLGLTESELGELYSLFHRGVQNNQLYPTNNGVKPFDLVGLTRDVEAEHA